MKIVFAGTPLFAATILEALLNTNHTILAVLTQPDRKAGRGQALNASPVKQLAIDSHIPCFQPHQLKTQSMAASFIDLKPDLMVVAAYGLLLPEFILNWPKYGCINVHASLLPRWRGASPILQAILAGDAQTGVTLMQMDTGLDTGAMLDKKTLDIKPSDTTYRLTEKLAALGARQLVDFLKKTPKTWQAETQNNAHATHAPKIKKSEGLIDWQEPAGVIIRKIHAFNPWPGAFSYCRKVMVKILEAVEDDVTSGSAQPGQIIKVTPQGIWVATPQNSLCIKKIQLPGKKVMPVNVYLNGHRQHLQEGTLFNS